MDQVAYAIKSVKETEYFVDETMELEEQYDFHYNATIQSKVEADEVQLSISVNYRKKGTAIDFLRGRTISVFFIKDMKSRASIKDGKETVDLPNPLWVTLFSISFTHARAMLARSAGGTKYGHLIMPLINPEVEFKKLFGEHVQQHL